MIDAKELLNKSQEMNRNAEELMRGFDSQMSKVIAAADPEDREKISQLVNEVKLHQSNGNLSGLNDLRGKAEALRDEINARKQGEQQAKKPE